MNSPRRRALVTTDLAVFAASSAASARLREQHLWPVLLDANTMVRDILHNADLGRRPSALMDAVVVGTARLYGKPDLLEEVADHLAPVAARKEHDYEHAQEILAFYTSKTRLADPSGVEIADSERRFVKVGARRKPDGRTDEPTARLSRLLDPAILLTDDPDLLDNGFGDWYEPGGVLAPWTAAAFTLKDRSFASQMDSGAKMAGLAVGLPVAAGASLVGLARAHPRAALGVGLLAAALGLATRDSPRWKTAHKNLSESFVAIMEEMVKRIPADPAQQQRDSGTAIAQLEEFRARHASPGSRVAIVARTLAIAPAAGLTPREIYDSTGHAFAVWPVLEAYPRLFSVDAAGHWLLGTTPRREAGAAVGS